jgi:hypothetical protein
MPTILVIDKDNSYFPKGWVSAVFPEGTSPSDYEKSGKLWKPVYVSSFPETVTPETLESPRPSINGFLYNNEKIFEVDTPELLLASHFEKERYSILPVLGPEHLDRSHSTVWDYGPGRTYSTPQTAFDALVAQTGPLEFTETHYVRGWSGTYLKGASGFVLGLTTVNPTRIHPLVIDSQDGENVVFDGAMGDSCVVGTAVSHVKVSKIKLINAGFGVAPSTISGPPVHDWNVVKCVADGSGLTMYLGIFLYNVDELRVLHCEFKNMISHGVGSFTGYTTPYKVAAQICGCLITSNDNGICTNSSAALFVFNNTIVAANNGLIHIGDESYFLAGMINNIFKGTSNHFSCVNIDADTPDLTIMKSEANCLNHGSIGYVAEIGSEVYGLSKWQDNLGQDFFSTEADPQLDSQFLLGKNSPCLSAGTCWDGFGHSGKPRSETIDMGHEQISLTKSPSISGRFEPEIRRK